MKYGVQIAITDDGTWSVSQLKQKDKNGPYARVAGSVEFVTHSNPLAAQNLLSAVSRGLKGRLRPGARCV